MSVKGPCKPSCKRFTRRGRCTMLLRAVGNLHDGQARLRRIGLTGDLPQWFAELATPVRALADLDAVLMRKDPPFDAEYFYATHLLEQAEREACPRAEQRRAAGQFARNPSLPHHEDPVGERTNLVEILALIDAVDSQVRVKLGVVAGLEDGDHGVQAGDAAVPGPRA